MGAKKSGRVGLDQSQLPRGLRAECSALQFIRLLNKAIPILLYVARRSALYGNPFSNAFCRNHLDRVPWTNGEGVRAILRSRQPDAHMTTNTSFQIDLTPTLQTRMVLARHLRNAIDGTNLDTGFATCAVVCIDDC